MQYSIKQPTLLRKILWADTLIDIVAGSTGLVFLSVFSELLGLPAYLLKTISIITLVYSCLAMVLANQKNVSIPLLRTLIYANWSWSVVSIGLFFFHWEHATLLGKTYLILQLITVMLLAYLEGRQIVASDKA
jgi:hypothetical protein